MQAIFSFTLCAFLLVAFMASSSAKPTLDRQTWDFNYFQKTGKRKMPENSLVCGGYTRTYNVHLPPQYNASGKFPVILAFHGGMGTAKGMARVSRLNRLANERGVIVVYPQGMNNHWQDGRNLAMKDSVDDVAFISKLLNKLFQDYSIDKSRVYATGISNGGFFAQRLACEMPDKFAAVASVAASRLVGMKYSPKRPIPIMFMLGTEDPLVPWAGGTIKGTTKDKENVYSGEQTLAYWLKTNHCSTVPNKFIDLKPDDGTHFVANSYKPMRGTSEVIFCKIEGGGHCWPGGVQYLPKFFVGTTSAVKGNEIIYDFFSQHHL